jgi:hypothetical protein
VTPFMSASSYPAVSGGRSWAKAGRGMVTFSSTMTAGGRGAVGEIHGVYGVCRNKLESRILRNRFVATVLFGLGILS